MLHELIGQQTPSAVQTTAELRRCRRQKSFWKFAKRLMVPSKSRKAVTETSVQTLIATKPLTMCSKEVDNETRQQLNARVLLSVFEYLPLLDRIRLRTACKLTDFIYGSIPIALPPLKLQTVNEEEICVFAENPSFIVNHLIPEITRSEINYEDDCIIIKNWQAQLLVQRIAQRIDKIEHFWLETTINGLLCTTVLNEIESEYGRKCHRRRKLFLQKLTIIGSKTNAVSEISDFVEEFSPMLEQLRLRHMRMESKELSEEFWACVNKCSNLHQFQYETCRYDKYSHLFIADALRDKAITTLELSGIFEFTAHDLSQITRGRPLKNLSVLCPKIKISSYLASGITESVEHVDTLLFRCGTSFALDDAEERKSVECVLRKMKDTSRLEVLHDVNNRVAQAARTISYWLQLSKETNRTIMLKLSDINQEKIDQAIGRIIRKCDNVFKAVSNCAALVLTREIGRVYLLDNHTWFGEDDEEI